tara:strand:- start:2628 stop:2768 length:141 start_codon:yes stop_codon:yes gene_type:complete
MIKKTIKDKRIALRLTKLEHLDLEIQSIKNNVSISKVIRQKLFNEK